MGDEKYYYFMMNSMGKMSKIFSINCENEKFIECDITTDIIIFRKKY